MIRFVMLAVSVVLLFNASIGDAQSKKPKVKPQETSAIAKSDNEIIANFMIKGRIKNIAGIKPYFNSNAYLQLLPKSGSMSIVVVRGETGGDEVVVSSRFPKINISQDGTFSLKVDSIAPGLYLLVINPVSKVIFEDKFGNDKLQFVLLAKPKNGQTLKLPDDRINIEIPTNAQLPFKIDLGDVFVPLPSVD